MTPLIFSVFQQPILDLLRYKLSLALQKSFLFVKFLWSPKLFMEPICYQIVTKLSVFFFFFFEEKILWIIVSLTMLISSWNKSENAYNVICCSTETKDKPTGGIVWMEHTFPWCNEIHIMYGFLGPFLCPAVFCLFLCCSAGLEPNIALVWTYQLNIFCPFKTYCRQIRWYMGCGSGWTCSGND